MSLMTIIAIACLLAGLGFLGHYFYMKNKAKDEKGFIVIAAGILLLWFCGGSGLFIIGLIILMILLMRGCA